MKVEIVAGAVGMGVVLIGLGFWILKRRPRRLKTEYYVAHWKELQAYCKDKSLWVKALAEADKLLDTALKKRKFKGKSMGERMVSAQRSLTDNDTLWFAHNLRKKLTADSTIKIKEQDIKKALSGFRQALRDVGGLPHKREEPENDK